MKQNMMKFILIVLIIFSVFLYVIINKNKEVETIDKGNQEEILTGEKIQEAYLISIWGEDYDKYIGDFIYKSPWDNVDLSSISPKNERELELISLIVFKYNPSLLLTDDEASIKIGNSEIDLKKIQDKYTQIRYYEIYNELKITGYRNNERFILYLEDGKIIDKE